MGYDSSGYTDAQIENAPMGSVFINNTSYSGCDIKVVLHVYNAGNASQERIDSLKEELDNITKTVNDAASSIQKLTDKLALEKIGTPGSEKLQTQLAKYRVQEDMLLSMQLNIMEEARRLQSGQSSFSTKTLAEIQTLSLSTHRDKRAIRTCGRVYPVGFSRGQREAAGSIVFTVFNQHVLYEFLEAHPSDFDANSYTSAVMDQLPPVDITIVFANEYGQTSRMAIYGVEFVNEGQTMSIEDIMTENVVNYVARDFDPMRSVQARKIDENNRLVSEWASAKASDLILEDEYQNTKTALDPFLRYSRRSSPFL